MTTKEKQKKNKALQRKPNKEFSRLMEEQIKAFEERGKQIYSLISRHPHLKESKKTLKRISKQLAPTIDALKRMNELKSRLTKDITLIKPLTAAFGWKRWKRREKVSGEKVSGKGVRNLFGVYHVALRLFQA